jgi:hypothetical protein
VQVDGSIALHTSYLIGICHLSCWIPHLARAGKEIKSVLGQIASERFTQTRKEGFKPDRR